MVNWAAVTVLVATVISPAMPTPIEEPVQPPEGSVMIEVFATNGSGCPVGTLQVSPSPKPGTTMFTFPAFLARIGVGTKPIDFRKNCQITLTITHPAGYALALSQFDYAGHASLAPGAYGTVRASYSFKGQTPTAPASHSVIGPFDDTWQFTDTSDLIATSYGPCGGPSILGINTEVRASAGTSDTTTTTSLVALDRAEIGPDNFTWKTCN